MMADDLIKLTVILVCVVLEGLFSGGELALVSTDIHRIRQKAEAGSRSALLALKLLQKPEWFFSTTLIGTNLCVVASTSMATALSISLMGPLHGPPIALIFMIPFLLVTAEIVPKTVFRQRAEFVAEKLSWFIWTASWLLFPFVYLISRISKGSVRLSARGQDVLSHPLITKDGLKYILQQGGERSDILSVEKEMVRNIIDFSDVKVDEIKVPLSNVIALPVTARFQEAIAVMSEKKHLRIPVYRDKIYNIIGILDCFDVMDILSRRDDGLVSHENMSIEACLRPVTFYVPETKLAKELLIELRLRNERMAVVVDEYGGATGIVTIEDILEEIVGEIEDEYDAGEKLYKQIGPNTYLFNAKIGIERFKEVVPLDIPEGEYETLGGFLLYKMKKIPRRKETLRFGDVLFIIEDADVKSIKEVFVEVQFRDMKVASGGKLHE